MKKSHISIDFLNNTLNLTKSFYKKACKVGSPEYQELRQAMSDNPTFDINFVENAIKTTYGKLTFDRMMAYIETQANSEDNLRMMQRVMAIAEAKGAKYPLTKKWFLETFPEYKMAITAQEIASKDAASTQDTATITLLDKAV